jgi:hypothetical protein
MQDQAEAAQAQAQAQACSSLDLANAQQDEAFAFTESSKISAQDQLNDRLASSDVVSLVDSSTQQAAPRLRTQLKLALDTDAQYEDSLPSSRVKDSLLEHLTAAARLDDELVTALASKSDEISASELVTSAEELIDDSPVAGVDEAVASPSEPCPLVVEAYQEFLTSLSENSEVPETLGHIDFAAVDLTALDTQQVVEIQEFHAAVVMEHVENTQLLEMSEDEFLKMF